MWKPLAEKPGWPTSQIGWQTIHNDLGKKWIDLGGLPEWGLSTWTTPTLVPATAGWRQNLPSFMRAQAKKRA
ncbi:MAG: hypothetical protein WA821_07830 [Anaerolineales bacterium]